MTDDMLYLLSKGSAAKVVGTRSNRVRRGTVLFRAGDRAQSYVIVVEGQIDVHLGSAGGRSILLYSITAGQSCVQTTLGLMGGEPYTGEAVAVEDSEIIMIPKATFESLLNADPDFRALVLRTFGQRMADITRLLEQVAFGRIEARLAAILLNLAEDGVVIATQAELAARIGSAREVVSRRLEAFQRAGWVETDRGSVRLTDPAALRAAALAPL